MPDSLFDGRPYIIADSILYALSARQISLLQTFDNPNAGQIIKLIESIDDVLLQSGDTITTCNEPRKLDKKLSGFYYEEKTHD